FIVSQPTRRTILMGLHLEISFMFCPGCLISLVLSFEEFILPGSIMHMVYCINSTRFHRLDISNSFVKHSPLGHGMSYPTQTECQNPHPRRNTTLFRQSQDNMLFNECFISILLSCPVLQSRCHA